jgi:hypothetical protein
MTTVALAPLAVWDTRDHGFWERERRWWREVVDWAQVHIPEADRTYRAEFYLVDAPFARVFRYRDNSEGRRYLDPATGEPAVEEPAVVVLSELPPRHLMVKR